VHFLQNWIDQKSLQRIRDKHSVESLETRQLYTVVLNNEENFVKVQNVTKNLKAGVLSLFPVNYPRVIKQSTRTPRSAGSAVDFTLLYHNNARSGKIYAEFSIGTHFPLVQGIKIATQENSTAIQVPLEAFP